MIASARDRLLIAGMLLDPPILTNPGKHGHPDEVTPKAVYAALRALGSEGFAAMQAEVDRELVECQAWLEDYEREEQRMRR